MNFYCYAHSALRKPIRDLAINPRYPKMAVYYDDGTIQKIAIPSLARTAQHRSRRTGIANGLTWSSDGTAIYSTNAYGHRALHWVNGLNSRLKFYLKAQSMMIIKQQWKLGMVSVQD